jgi:acyl-coenzyme A thioesterase PaaI-like protein
MRRCWRSSIDEEPVVTEADGENIPPRIKLLHGLENTPRRVELRRLAAAGRDVIDHLVSTTATIDELAAAADQLEAVARVLAEMPSGQDYIGYAEAANAGLAIGGSDGLDLDLDDPERFASFDHSPFIGLANPMSPPMYFRAERHRVTGTVNFGAAYEGPPGCVHGGYVAAAFDELLGAAQSLSGTQGMTARLVVNYRSPTPLRTELRMQGQLSKREGRKIYCDGQLWAGDRLCAEAEGLFISLDPDRFGQLLQDRRERMESEGSPPRS